MRVRRIQQSAMAGACLVDCWYIGRERWALAFVRIFLVDATDMENAIDALLR